MNITLIQQVTNLHVVSRQNNANEAWRSSRKQAPSI